jgi:hypothetical protein
VDYVHEITIEANIPRIGENIFRDGMMNRLFGDFLDEKRFPWWREFRIIRYSRVFQNLRFLKGLAVIGSTAEWRPAAGECSLFYVLLFIFPRFECSVTLN